MKYLPTIVFLLVTITNIADAEVRDWRDRSGAEFTAEFSTLTNGMVSFKRATTRVPPKHFYQLSDRDQLYLRNMLEAEGNAYLIPKRGEKRMWVTKSGGDFVGELLGVEDETVMILSEGEIVTYKRSELTIDDVTHIKTTMNSWGLTETGKPRNLAAVVNPDSKKKLVAKTDDTPTVGGTGPTFNPSLETGTSETVAGDPATKKRSGANLVPRSRGGSPSVPSPSNGSAQNQQAAPPEDSGMTNKLIAFGVFLVLAVVVLGRVITG